VYQEETAMPWYIVKQPTGHCEIVQVDAEDLENKDPKPEQTWGPFDAEGEAIARRVGLIRAGKCQPKL
jgi:hypothetical protein